MIGRFFRFSNARRNNGNVKLNDIGNQHTFSEVISHNQWTQTHYYYKNTQTYTVLHHCKGYVYFQYIYGGVRSVYIKYIQGDISKRFFYDSRLACDGAFATVIPFDFTIVLEPNDEIIMNLCQYNSESSEMNVDVVYYINEVKLN